jgi:imidazolonepropionase-like amidohydrolase
MLAASTAALFGLAPAQVAVRAATVHTMAGAAIEDGVVVVEGGRITAVGPAASTPIPDGLRLLRARVCVPGLIDSRATVGLAGFLGQAQDSSELELSAAMQPELRAIDAYDARDPLVGWLRERGVTTVHTGHAPGALISGQTMIVKTGPGATLDANLVRPFAMVAAALGQAATGPDGKPPGTRSKAVAMLRQRLIEARAYAGKRAVEDEAKRPAIDLGLDALCAVLRGEVPLLVHAHRDRDLRAALRIAEEFGIRLVLDGAAEAYREIEPIRAASVPVLAHPPMLRSSGDAENATFRLGAVLREAGIPFAYQSGHEGYVPRTRVLLFEAAVGAAHGLGFEGALRAVTIDAARILGVDDRIGSLEVGKDGDLALFDGDPFEYTTHCTAVVIDGAVVHEGAR